MSLVTDMADPAEERLAHMEKLLESLANHIRQQENSAPPASVPPSPGPAEGPGLFTDILPTTKLALRPNPLAVFNGDRAKGRSFLHSVKMYTRLLPEAFVENGEPSEEKVVRYAMSYMAEDSAQCWVECQSAKSTFPFASWESFVWEFCLCFVEKNKQDHTLAKLEGWGYYSL